MEPRERDLSPDTEKNLVIMMQQLKMGEIKLGQNGEGKVVTLHTDKKALPWGWDKSRTGSMAPSGKDTELYLGACLELIEYMKKERSPAGTALSDKVSLSHGGNYKETKENSKQAVDSEKGFFFHTGRLLGRGNTAGAIVIVKDCYSQVEMGKKTILIADFRENEIRCWRDMSETGLVPSLHLLRLEDNNIEIFMEIVQGVTLKSIIEERMSNINKQELVEPFAFFLFHDLISAVQVLHEKGWVHRDLHSGNIMAVPTTKEGMVSEMDLKFQLIDFGSAQEVSHEGGLAGLRLDIAEIVRKFCAVFLGDEFDSAKDLRDNWQERLTNYGLEDRKDIFQLLEAALSIVDVTSIQPLREKLAEHIDRFDRSQIMKEVIPLLFTKEELLKMIGPKVLKREVNQSPVQADGVDGKGDNLEEEPIDLELALSCLQTRL